MTRHLLTPALIVALGLVAPLAAPGPAAAQSSTDETEEGLDLLGEGARRLLEGLSEDLSPLLEQLQDQLEGLQAYEAPEVLPNGDIIIRRKPEGEVDPERAPEMPEDDGPVEL